jgi:hypothetical protein
VSATLVVENLDQINKRINLSGKLYAAAMHNGLLQGAEPIRQDAGRLSQIELSGMRRAKIKPPPWSVQRKGQTVHEVYIAPTQRGRHGGKNSRDERTDGARRRAEKFVERMMGKAYEPALERNEGRLRVYVDNWLGSVTREI